jgi:1-acyl-sn-glycerol-3-phosphate acyltransferase
MTITPHIDAGDPDFPGDPSPQTPFTLKDSLRSFIIWSIGIPHLAAWTGFVVMVSKLTDTKNIDKALNLMARAVPALAGVHINVEGREKIDPSATYVYVVNHVNIFDMFAIYKALPQYARSLEHIDHFSWPLFGPFIKALGQIPVDPSDKRVTAKGLKTALKMLKTGNSLVVLPEGERTLDGSVGHFYPGAFRLAIGAKVAVVPMAIYAGRTVSRRSDWRVRPGTMSVLFADPVSTERLTIKDADALAADCKKIIIEMLKKKYNDMRN